MKRRGGQSLLVVLLVLIVAGASYPCGYDYTFRAYLDKRFWQPFARYEKAMGVQPGRVGDEEIGGEAFAGMTTGGTPALQGLRNAYRKGDYVAAERLVAPALAECPQGREREEILVLGGKVALRQGERGDNRALGLAEGAFTSYLAGARDPALASEARGWLARVYFLSGRYAAAAKVYLDEAQRTDSIFSRSSLVASLRTLYRYNGGNARIGDHLEEYFDTPAHALFAVTIATNPVYVDEEERAAMAETARKALRLLLQRKDLLVSGGASDALVLALMRAALFMGDTKTALSFAEQADSESRVRSLPEYNWMAASSNYLQKRYAAAEKHLLAMYRSPAASSRDRSAAAQGLMGVYQALGRGADQLHAAFLAKEQEEGAHSVDGEQEGFPTWPGAGDVFDLPYLLDVGLTDEELGQYLQRNKGAARKIRVSYSVVQRSDAGSRWSERRRTAGEIVKYALAVRHARAERYEDAALLYREIGATPRAKRMETLARIFADAADPARTREQQLEARYRYAGFLAEHSTQIFFNDMFWRGMQTWTFVRNDFGTNTWGAGWMLTERVQGLTKSQRETCLRQERQLRDAQEEYWRAYTILADVAKETADSDLGQKAVALSLKCLRRINTDRFGRSEAIAMAIRRLEEGWLLGAAPPR